MPVDVGAKAPEFTLPNQDREPVSLSEQLKNGPVVVAFFPAAFSSVCTTEMCTFRDSASELNTVGAKVLGISVDTFFALKAWADAQKLDFPLLSDPTKETAKAYGVLADRGFANRWTFYIGKDGRIQAIDKDVANRLATSAEDMATKLGELKTPMAMAKK